MIKRILITISIRNQAKMFIIITERSGNCFKRVYVQYKILYIQKLLKKRPMLIIHSLSLFPFLPITYLHNTYKNITRRKGPYKYIYIFI